MPQRKLVLTEVKCKICGTLIVDDALLDERLVPFLQTKGLCPVCQDKEKSGTTANLDMRDRLVKKEVLDVYHEIDERTGRKRFCGRFFTSLY